MSLNMASTPSIFGIARDPARRLIGLQNAHFDQLQFHRFWWLPGRPIAAQIEHAFKKNFAPAAIRGEWFDVPLQAAETFIAEMIRSLGTWSIDQNDMVKLMEQWVQHRMERSLKRIRAGEPLLWKLIKEATGVFNGMIARLANGCAASLLPQAARGATSCSIRRRAVRSATSRSWRACRLIQNSGVMPK